MTSQRTERESIWSVDRRVKNYYYFLFTLFFWVGLSLLAYLGYVDKDKNVADRLVSIWKDAGLIVLASAAIAMTATEVGGYIVSLLSSQLEKRDAQRRKLREELRKEAEENILNRLPEQERERIRKELEGERSKNGSK